MPNPFEEIHQEAQGSGGGIFDQIHSEEKGNELTGGNSRLDYKKDYSTIATDPNTSLLHKGAMLGEKVGDEVGRGLADVAKGLPGAVVGLAKGAMPTSKIPVPGGRAAEDTAKGFKDSMELASKGRFSDAAKKIPMVGGAYDYATSHPIAQTAGNALGQVMVGGMVTKGASKLGEVPKSTAIFGEHPAIKEQMGILKPANAKHAIEDYPLVNARLLREHPDLAKGKATLPEIDKALNETMSENRYYEKLHTGPSKAAGMPVNLAPIASAIRGSITPLMRQEAEGHVTALEKLADKYDKVGSINDLESFLHETNAKVADMRKLNPGEWSQVKNASETKGLLTATNKAFRDTYYKALELFNGSDAVRQLNKEYGAMMGFRQDLADLVQRELTSDHPPTGSSLGAKVGAAGAALRHPVRTAVSKTLESFEPAADRISRFAKTFKDFKGSHAPDYPAPPQFAGPGGGPGSPGNIAAGAYPGATGKPAGPAAPLPASRQIAAPQPPPLVTPPPPDASGVYSRAPQGITVHPGRPGQKLLGPATPGQPGPLVTPAPADTSGVVDRTGTTTPPGMGVSAGRKVGTAEGHFHPPSEHGSGTAPTGYTWVQDRGHWVLTNVETLGHQMGPGKPLPRRTK